MEGINHMRKLSLVVVASMVSLLAAIPAGGLAISAAPTTLDQTIVAEGERDLGYGPGESRVTRTLGWKKKKGKGKPLAGFKHVSDIHLVDEESPGRVEWFDECPGISTSAYRPQEAMSAQVGESMIRTLNSFTEGPVIGAPLGFTISTGDNIDNNQKNELLWFIDLLNGGTTVTPDSGAPGYDGYTQAQTPNALSDEILELAQQAFEASGVGRWYAVLGNHDGLVQGNLPANTTFRFLVTQGKKVFINPFEYLAEEKCPASISEAEDAFFAEYFSDNAQEVPADTLRIFQGHKDVVNAYANADGVPDGHGLKNTPDDPSLGGPAGYYTFNLSNDVVGIVMDTLSYDGSSEGILNDSQYTWIEQQLKKYSKVYYNTNGKRRRNDKGKNKMVVLFSHHTSLSMNNPGTYVDATAEQIEAMLPQHCFERDAAEGCEDGEGFRELLNRYPNVIAWVNGHEHNNRVAGFPAAEGQDPARAWWEVNTAAHIDWPQQSRLIEIAYKPGKDGKPGSIFIYGTILDHLAAPDPDLESQDTVEYLSSLSRVEAYYDACVRERGADCAAGGAPRDRNVKLVQKAPFKL
jgi:hypothetical protein